MDRIESCSFEAGDASKRAITDKQLQALGLVAAGHTDAEAARSLGVSLGQFRYQLRTGVSLLGARNRPQAVAIAITSGWIAPSWQPEQPVLRWRPSPPPIGLGHPVGQVARFDLAHRQLQEWHQFSRTRMEHRPDAELGAVRSPPR